MNETNYPELRYHINNVIDLYSDADCVGNIYYEGIVRGLELALQAVDIVDQPAQVPERSKGADCKSVQSSVRI